LTTGPELPWDQVPSGWTHGVVTCTAVRAHALHPGDTPFDIEESHSMTVVAVAFTEPAQEGGVMAATGAPLNWRARVFPALNSPEWSISEWAFTAVQGLLDPLDSQGLPGDDWQERVCDMVVASGDGEPVGVEVHVVVSRGSGPAGASTGGGNLQLADEREAIAEIPPLAVTALYPGSSRTAHSRDPGHELEEGEIISRSLELGVRYATASDSVTLSASGGWTGNPLQHLVFDFAEAQGCWTVTSAPGANPLTVRPCPREGGEFAGEVQLRIWLPSYGFPFVQSVLVDSIAVTLSMDPVECDWVCGRFSSQVASNEFYWGDLHDFSYSQSGELLIMPHTIRERLTKRQILTVTPASGIPFVYPPTEVIDYSPPASPISVYTTACQEVISGWLDEWALQASSQIHETHIFGPIDPGDLPLTVRWNVTWEDQHVFLDDDSECPLEFPMGTGRLVATYVVSGEISAPYILGESLSIEAVTPTGVYHYPE
ncbi:MAG: hypothetical protein DYG91_14480, partial [Chloroflexi bacterium CFX7]|nr:hypothetical protein [Chloroflexi bacterium CFX7]